MGEQPKEVQYHEGLKTIQRMSPIMEDEIPVSFAGQYAASLLQSVLGASYISIVPYCTFCIQPLVWIKWDEHRLFGCPQCGKIWVKSESWVEDARKFLAKEEKK